MREHIVHLTRDSFSLEVTGLVNSQLLLGLGSRGALTQRLHKLPAGSYEHPPREDGAVDDEVHGQRREDGEPKWSWFRHAEGPVGHSHHGVQDPDDRHRTETTVYGNSEHGHA